MWWLLAIVAVGFLAATAYLYFAQRGMVFYPTRTIEITPADINITYDDVYIPVNNGERIHAWYVPPRDLAPDAPVVIFSHGNAGNISHRLETLDFLVRLGAGVLLFDYRGYGRSDGTPGEDEAYADIAACYDWLTAQHRIDPARIVLFGRSLGGAVAADLAVKRPCRGLIVESSFTSLAAIGSKMFPVFPVRWLLKYDFDTVGKIGRVTCPVLVTHSPVDEMIPFAMGRELYEAARPPKRLVELIGDHNGRAYFDLDTYRLAVQDILSGAAREW